MKKFKLTWWRVIAILVCVLILLVIFRPPMGARDAAQLATSVFELHAKRYKLKPEDFEPYNPPKAEHFIDAAWIGFEWRHKLKPKCLIEVDVDLYYANARPRVMNCD